MRPYVLNGPPRFRHQRLGLRRLIETRGVCGLLFDPGTGKTATALDYAGLLALKSPTGEARVLVISPLVAVDTWVGQAETYLTPDIDYWAEAVGGDLFQRAETLAARGGNPYKNPVGFPKTIPPRPSDLLGDETEAEVARFEAALKEHDRVRRAHNRFRRQMRLGAPHYARNIALGARRRDGAAVRYDRGPAQLAHPRLIIEVVSIDTFSQRTVLGSKTMADLMYDAVLRYNPDLVIVDESHKIKGVSANASRLLARIAKKVPRRVILTGTVMPHSPLDVWAQWRFLEPYAFGTRGRESTYGEFKDRYAVLGGWMGKEVKGFRRLDEMQEIMARNSVVARKEDALDLPPTQDVVIPVHLEPAEAKAYQELKANLATMLADGSLVSTPNRLVQMMRLRQITSGHLPDDSTGTVQVIGKSKVRTIASLVNDTLAGEKRVVVFALFTKEIELLKDALAVSGTEVMAITGGTPVKDREKLRKRFGSSDPQRIVMIAQIKTMSLAVNELVTANHAVFASLSQQRDDMVQARDRLDRLGQTRPVTFWYALAPGTIDTVILESHRDRTNLESAALAHIQSTHDTAGLR